mmetsp:Transcript_12371/g.49837  ORF Transcript_12371/g.49837 Transcript_12371/m.49837 type:complete len:366 (+) Transcript_12371:1-1098(+)
MERTYDGGHNGFNNTQNNNGSPRRGSNPQQVARLRGTVRLPFFARLFEAGDEAVAMVIYEEPTGFRRRAPSSLEGSLVVATPREMLDIVLPTAEKKPGILPGGRPHAWRLDGRWAAREAAAARVGTPPSSSSGSSSSSTARGHSFRSAYTTSAVMEALREELGRWARAQPDEPPLAALEAICRRLSHACSAFVLDDAADDAPRNNNGDDDDAGQHDSVVVTRRRGRYRVQCDRGVLARLLEKSGGPPGVKAAASPSGHARCVDGDGSGRGAPPSWYRRCQICDRGFGVVPPGMESVRRAREEFVRRHAAVWGLDGRTGRPRRGDRRADEGRQDSGAAVSGHPPAPVREDPRCWRCLYGAINAGIR